MTNSSYDAKTSTNRKTMSRYLSFSILILILGQLVDGQTTTPATTLALPTAAPELGATSTTDSLAVNLDESNGATTSVSSDSPETTTLPPDEDLLVEGRSSRTQSDGVNSLGGEQGDKTEPGKLDAEQDSDGKPKRAPLRLNMTQVDQLYNEARRDQHQVADSWRLMEKKLKKSVGNIIGSIVPVALNMSQEARISSNCTGAVLKWVLSMNQLKSWALRMLDASGKPISGLLEGSLTMFGNYRQCLRVRAPDDDEIELDGKFHEYFRGKYCILQAKPWLPEKSQFYNLNTKIGALVEGVDKEQASYDQSVFDELSEWVMAFNYVNIRMDLCVPSMCSREDLQKAVNFLIKGIDLKVRILRCEMESLDGTGHLSVEDAKQWKQDNLLLANSWPASDSSSDSQSASTTNLVSSSSIGLWLVVPTLAIVVVIVASAAATTISQRHATSNGLSKLTHAIRSLSIQRSIDSHLDVDYNQLADDKPLALYGIRFMLVLWVILVESAVNLKFEYLRELLMLKDLIFWWPLQVIINSTLQFDSIILLTAFTMSYKNCLNEVASNAKRLTRFVLDKYIRLMPSVMVLVAMVILLPLVYRGPVWNDYVTRQSEVCQSTGWLNVVFLQNNLPYEQICLPQTWLLCIELQLVLLMAPIVYYLNKSYVKQQQQQQQLEKPANDRQLNFPSEDRQQSGKSRGSRAEEPFYWVTTKPGAVLMLCVLAGFLGSFFNVYAKKLPPSWFYTMPDPEGKSFYFGEHMLKLWTHLAVFSVGILAGLECRRATRNVNRGYRAQNLVSVARSISSAKKSAGKQPTVDLSNSTTSLPVLSHSDSMSSKSTGNELMGSSVTINLASNYHQHYSRRLTSSSPTTMDEQQGRARGLSGEMQLAACLVAVGVMTMIIFSTHGWSVSELPSPLVAGLFDAASRCLWSVAFVWLLYMVSVPNEETRQFSRLSKMLGHPIMVFLGKLSFLIYILYPVVHTTVLAIQEQPIYSSWLMLFHILIGNMTITILLASMLSLFVEMPCRNLFRRCGHSMFLAHSNSTLEPSSSSSSSMKHQ